MAKALIFTTFLLILSSCATSSRDYAPSKQSSDTSTVVGKILVLVNGKQEDLQETGRGVCELVIENEGQEIKYKIEKSGEFYLNAKPGVFFLKNIMCFTGIISQSQYVFYTNIPTSVLEKGAVNYVGDLTINWQLGGTQVAWAELLSYGGNGFYRYGPIDMQVAKTDETLRRFIEIHPELKSKLQSVRLIQFIDRNKL